jgi:ferredoxin
MKYLSYEIIFIGGPCGEEKDRSDRRRQVRRLRPMRPQLRRGALKIVDGKARLVSDVYCDGLGACLGHCPRGAVSIVEREAPEFSEEAVHDYLANREPLACGCPSSQAQSIEAVAETSVDEPKASVLRHWPVQLNLVPVKAPFFRDADLLIIADCVAVAYPHLHARMLERQKHCDGMSQVRRCPGVCGQTNGDTATEQRPQPHCGPRGGPLLQRPGQDR